MRIPLGLLLFSLVACEESAPAGKAPSRFDSVKATAQPLTSEAAKFCDEVLPASGPGSRPYVAPPDRPVPGYTPTDTRPGTWRWLNMWATWCKPCVEEMGLVGRWKDALEKEGKPLEVDLLSIDEDEPAISNWVAKKPMPGHVKWLRSGDDLAPVLKTLGVDSNSAIPIHAFVDPAGQIRCVRVGSIREGDYAAVRAIVAGK